LNDFVITSFAFTGDGWMAMLIGLVIVFGVLAFTSFVFAFEEPLLWIGLVVFAGLAIASGIVAGDHNDRLSSETFKAIESHGVSQIDYTGHHQFTARYSGNLIKCSIDDLHHDNQYLVKCTD
jgi:hypothetical protein